MGLRIAVALIFGLLSVSHILFGFTNLGYVEELPGDLNVAAEGLGAIIAGLALASAALQDPRTLRPWLVLLLTGCVFLAAMLLSVATGASDPPMLLVALIVPLIGTVGFIVTWSDT
jgi:hypothetical protein